MATRKNNASSRITIRLTDDEHSRLLSEAGRASVSAHARKCLFGESTRKTKLRMPLESEVLLAGVLAKLGQSRLLNNLNQLAKAVNIGALPVTPETESEIISACTAVTAMRRDLILALGLRSD